jgi:putative ABC transport system substrate-binding protein
MGLAVAVPTTWGQPRSTLPLIAILEPGPQARPATVLAGMKEALAQLGWVEGSTARFEIRYCDWRDDRMLEMARELVYLKPAVLYTHSTPGVRAATQATTSIPIVVGVAGDLLGTGVVKSLAQPGGNVTGMTLAMPELDRKRLEILKEALPTVSRIAFLIVPGMTPETMLRAVDDAAGLLRVEVLRVPVREPSHLEAAFNYLVNERAQALFVADTAMFAANVEHIAALALKHRLPAISQAPRFADSGGLLSYGADVLDLGRRSATYVDKILKGARPGDLPVEQPTKVDLILNMKTARALGIPITPTILLRAARVIE